MNELKKKLILLERGEITVTRDSVPERDTYAVIIARAFLLFVLTFDLWMNAYLIMSLDRNNMLIGTFTIITCAVGQFSAITGQFGYPIGDFLLKIYNICAVLLLSSSVFLGEFGNNFMTELSFAFSITGLLTGIFIMLLRAKDQ